MTRYVQDMVVSDFVHIIQTASQIAVYFQTGEETVVLYLLCECHL